MKKFVITAIVLCSGLFCLSACRYIPFMNKEEKIITGERTMVFCHWDEEHQAVYEQLAKSYMEQQEGLEIIVQSSPYEEYQQSKQLPDLFAVPAGDEFEYFAESKKLKALSAADVTAEHYDKRLLACGTSQKNVLAVPITAEIPVIYYQKSIYESYQLVEPLTVSDFLINCYLLKDNGITPLLLSVQDGLFDSFDFTEGILANGPKDSPLVAEGRFSGDTKSIDGGFFDLGGLAFELVNSDYLLPFEQAPVSRQQLLEQFAAGEVAMIPGTTGDYEILREMMEEEPGYFPMPGSDVFNSVVIKAEMMLGISKDSKLAADATGFLNYLLTPEAQKVLCDETKAMPVVTGIQLSEESFNRLQQYYSVSVFQRISSRERQICRERIHALLTGNGSNLEVFLSEWKNELDGK